MAEMPSLEGEKRVFQEKRVKDLLDAANEQQSLLDPVIQYFIDGCQDGTLLKHKLMCSEPTSLAVLMAKADKYTTADSAMRVKVTASDKIVPTPSTPKPVGNNRGGQNNKRKEDQQASG
ncbi:Endoglucanase 3 [Hordeum vulgare]|nr:Endoglucanase 3 [Hordeum vulgare]